MWSKFQRCVSLLLIWAALITSSLLVFIPVSSANSAKPYVVVSIEPLAKITRELLGDSADIEVLLPQNANPHQYALKFSDLARIKAASLVVWNGPALEPYLQGVITKAGVPNISFQSLSLSQDADVHENPSEENSGLEESSLEKKPYIDEASHQASHAYNDPHYWLSPQESLGLAQAIADQVGLPAQKLRSYRDSQQRLLAEWLPQLEGKRVAVYHDGYSHLAQAFGFEIVAAVSAGEGKGVSIAKRLKLSKQMKEASCLIAEPYSDAKRATQLSRQEGLKLVWLDPLSSQSSGGEYHPWVSHLVTQLMTCFTEGVSR